MNIQNYILQLEKIVKQLYKRNERLSLPMEKISITKYTHPS